MQITPAITELKRAIAAQGYTAELLEEIAEEFDLKPALLARKFQEATGRLAGEWAAAPAVADAADRICERARAIAGAEYRGGVDVAGRTFEGKLGRRYAAIAVCADGIDCLRLSDGARRRITFKTAAARDAFALRRIVEAA